MRISVAVVLLACALATSCKRPFPIAPDRSSIAGAVEAFQRALASGDRAAAMSLLSDDAQIVESGTRETREQYESAHLAEDIEFAKSVTTTPGPLIVRQKGNTAWTTRTSRSAGKFHGNDVDGESADLMVLSKQGDRWQIRAIHWSTHSHRAAH
jgi:ketosteroid isomerase-like protein